MGTNKVASVILLDVSKSMSNESNNGNTYFDRAINCVKRMLLRKMFSQDNDDLGIILFGANRTKNDLARGALYNNILVFWNLQMPNWELFRKVENLKVNDTYKSDWIEALIVGMDFMRSETQGRKYRSKQIVVFSSFSSQIKGDDQSISPLISALEGENVSLLVVGKEIEEEENACGSELPSSQRLIFSAVSQLDSGVHYSFDEIENELEYFEKKRKMCRLLKVNLLIGSEIQLPCRWMKFTNEETRFKWGIPFSSQMKSEPTGDKITNPGTSRQHSKNLEFVTDTVKVTNFGLSVVELSYADIQAMSRKTGGPSFIYLGCIKSSKVPRSMFVGNDIYVVVPDKNVRSVAMFSAFVDALLKAKKYGIARRVPVKNGKVTIGALLPVSDHLGKALFFMKLPYAEWVQRVPERCLGEPEENEEEEKAINDLIDAAMLPEDLAEEGKGLLLRDPTFQSRCHAISLRAMGMLPPSSIIDIPESIQRLIDPQPLNDKAKEALHRIAEMFPYSDLPQHPAVKLDNSKNVEQKPDLRDIPSDPLKKEIQEIMDAAQNDKDFAEAFNEDII